MDRSWVRPLEISWNPAEHLGCLKNMCRKFDGIKLTTSTGDSVISEPKNSTTPCFLEDGMGDSQWIFLKVLPLFWWLFPGFI